MKTIRLFGVALLTVLMSVGFSSCSKSDDDNGGGSSASIEGIWYAKSEYDYNWDYTNDKPDMSKAKRTHTYNDYDQRYTHTITKNGNGYTDKYTDGDDDWYGIYEFNLISGNEYDLYDVHKSDNRKEKVGTLVVKSVTEKQMVWEVTTNRDGDKGFCVLTLMR